MEIFTDCECEETGNYGSQRKPESSRISRGSCQNTVNILVYIPWHSVSNGYVNKIRVKEDMECLLRKLDGELRGISSFDFIDSE